MKPVDIRRKLQQRLLSPLGVLLAAACMIHFILYLYDIGHPAVFMTADRAAERMQIIRRLAQCSLSISEIGRQLQSGGLVGDYIFAAITNLLGGRLLTIAVQVILHLASIYCVVEIGFRLFNERRLEAIAAG